MVDDIRPPELAEAEDASENDTNDETPQAPDSPHSGKLKGPNKAQRLLKAPKYSWDWLRFKHSHLNRKQKIIFWAAMAILLILGSAGVYAAYKHFHKPIPTENTKPVKKEEPPAPTTVPSPLTGYPVDPALAKRPVTGVMIENSPDARPQAGLNEAGIVFEAIAEGGITRFLALYQESQPDYIGPVRSVRPYYLDFLMPFDASIAHAGGAPVALGDIKTLGVKDLDQFANSGAYQRVGTRYAPHNLYTSSAQLDSLNSAKGFTSSAFTSFERKEDKPYQPPSAGKIDINISGYFYNVHYDYDQATNSYKRSEGGAPHVHEKSGAQITPKVVITLEMSRGIASDGQHTDYGTTGSGKMTVFQDGAFYEGTWSKAGRKDQFVFKDPNGQPIKLNVGQTWITIVDPGTVFARP